MTVNRTNYFLLNLHIILLNFENLIIWFEFSENESSRETWDDVASENIINMQLTELMFVNELLLTKNSRWSKWLVSAKYLTISIYK